MSYDLDVENDFISKMHNILVYIKDFHSSINTINKVRNHAPSLEMKGSALYITDKELAFRIFKENIQRTPTVHKKKKQPNRIEKEIQSVNKHLKRCST